MRLIHAVLTKDNRFDVSEGFPVFMKPFPHVPVGRPNKDRLFWRIPIGMRFAESLIKERECPRDGEAAIGVCPFCEVNITPDKIQKIERQVGHIQAYEPVAKHGKVRWIDPITKANLILTREKKTLMVVQENPDDHRNRSLVAVLVTAEGDCFISMEKEPEEFKDIHARAVGQRYVKGALSAVERIFIMRKYDRFNIFRSGESLERIVVEMTSGMCPKVISAVKSTVDSSQAALEKEVVGEAEADIAG